MVRQARLALAGMLTVLGHAPALAAQAAPVGQRQPLNCQGGAGLVFDTIAPPSDTGRVVVLSLTFAANPSAAGAEGETLHPSTCAWVDRPLSDAEPRRVRLRLLDSDTMPGRTVRDTGIYWSFLIEDTESGHLVARGYRYWHVSSPPRPMAAPQPSPAPRRGGWLPFDPRNLPWFLAAWVLIVGVPMSFLTAWWSGWKRLVDLYPGRDTGGGRSFSCGTMVMGRASYRGGVRARPDDSHLHFKAWILFRPGHPPFSVPWADITATRDQWPWFPLKGTPVIRLTLARYRELRILVPRGVGERIVAESGGRLHLSEPLPPPLVAR